jgi:hypothetical protein
VHSYNHYTILSPVVWMTFFSTLPHKPHIFWKKKKLLNKIYMFRFSLQFLFETLRILRRILWEMIINVHRSSCKLPAILVRFQSNMNFLNIFSKNTQISNFTKIHSGEAELLQTDMTKLIVVFCNFANEPTNPQNITLF